MAYPKYRKIVRAVFLCFVGQTYATDETVSPKQIALGFQGLASISLNARSVPLRPPGKTTSTTATSMTCL
jgi:hypothetical protein